MAQAASGAEKLLLAVLREKARERPPIWLMRQAGRYLPEYRALRATAKSFLELCFTPDLAAEITLQPVRRYGMDAAILFSDILVVADALGCFVDFVDGAGPKLVAVRSAAAIARLGANRVEERLAPVYETLRRVRAALAEETALIGFAGAPWTVAAYMVEGESSREFHVARAFARREPDAFGALIDLLCEATTRHLCAQIEAGADLVQLFDSWAGVLPESEFRRWCEAPLARIVAGVKAVHPDVPVIAFPRGAGVLYRSFVEAVPVDAVSLDTTVPLAWARREIGGVCLQGNLDPVALLTGDRVLREETERIVGALAGRHFIFNLGHGVLPDTPPEHVAALVDQVRSLRLPLEEGS